RRRRGGGIDAGCCKRDGKSNPKSGDRHGCQLLHWRQWYGDDGGVEVDDDHRGEDGRSNQVEHRLLLSCKDAARNSRAVFRHRPARPTQSCPRCYRCSPARRAKMTACTIRNIGTNTVGISDQGIICTACEPSPATMSCSGEPFAEMIPNMSAATR